MSPLRLQGSTSGYSQIDAPAVAGDQTFTLPGTGGTLTTAEGGQTIAFGAGSASTPSITTTGDSNTGVFFPAADTIAFAEGGAEAMRIDSSGRVGIGTTSPGAPLEVNGNVRITNANNLQLANTGDVQFLNAAGTSYSTGIIGSSDNMILYTTDLERARIDSSGRLLVGTSTARTNFFNSTYTAKEQVEGTGATGADRGALAVINNSSGDDAPLLILAKSKGTTIGSNTLCTNNEYVGHIAFQANDGSEFVELANIIAQVDGTSGANDMPGRIVLATTADGASSPTERMRISSTGGVRLPDVYNQTIALGANVFIDSDGTLKRATSSIKYKTNVETLEDQYADAVLNCRPVWYQSTSPGDNPNWGFWGFIAEEVAEIDPRLVQWKTVEQVINEDGSRDTVSLETPEPENVAYDRFVPHLLNLIKRQKEQIEAMEARLTALEQS